MRFEMKMPDLATTESEIRIVQWRIEPGEQVARGQALVEVETDKATMDVESAVGGVLRETRCDPGTSVSVGDVIAVLEVEAAVAGTASEKTPRQELSTKAPAAAAVEASPPAARAPGGMFARNRAATDGRAAPDDACRLSVAQRTSARRLQQSKQTIPHFYLQTSADASGIVTRRAAAAPAPPAWDAFFVLALARAIGRFPRFACRWEGEQLVPASTDAIGVAVDHEGDLFVLPVEAAASKTVDQISDEIRQGLNLLGGGDSDVRRIRPALMTVTNLGVCDVESFIPIINPPETAILGVGKVLPAAVVRDGQMVVEHRCRLTLSVDHRVASGRAAGEFLGRIVRELEALGGEAA